MKIEKSTEYLYKDKYFILTKKINQPYYIN